MQDKSSKIVAYAAGAAFAAATVVYIFGPSIFPEYRPDRQSAVGRSPSNGGFVGLLNPANDCYINSVLQALAGLSDLRSFLDRELDRRRSNYKEEGIVSVALNEILQNLNENPLHRKTISAQRFIKSLEHVHHARISGHQQDAQEFFLAIAEKLNDEWLFENRSGRALGRETRKPTITDYRISTERFTKTSGELQNTDMRGSKPNSEKQGIRGSLGEEEFPFAIIIENDDCPVKFPFGGELESQIECLTCHYKPKPTNSTFVSLTLPVPVKTSTSLDSCFDSLTKVEQIDDYRCEACRLNHALALKEKTLLLTRSSTTLSSLHTDITIIRNALKNDPEIVEDNAHLPPINDAPKRRIMRYTRISRFPKVLAVHLSRSLYGVAMTASKNTAQVSFPVVLPLGGLLLRATYSLAGIITHKGGHQSGHYESYRRRGMSPESLLPSLDPDSSKPKTIQISSGNTEFAPNHSLSMEEASQDMEPWRSINLDGSTQQNLHYESDILGSKKVDIIRKSEKDREKEATTDITSTHSLERRKKRQYESHRNLQPSLTNESHDDRWWRISDDKAWEVRTSDVLAMQKEVYLLFYERNI